MRFTSEQEPVVRRMEIAILTLASATLALLAVLTYLVFFPWRSPLETRAAAHCRVVAERIRRDLRQPSDATHRDLAELVAGDEIYVCLGRSITIDQAVDTIDDLRRLP